MERLPLGRRNGKARRLGGPGLSEGCFGGRSGDGIGSHVELWPGAKEGRSDTWEYGQKLWAIKKTRSSDDPRLRMMDVMGNPVPCGFVFICSCCWGLRLSVVMPLIFILIIYILK